MQLQCPHFGFDLLYGLFQLELPKIWMNVFHLVTDTSFENTVSSG